MNNILKRQIIPRDMSKRYVKEIDGKKEIKTAREIVIHKNGGVLFSPTEKMILEDGWVEYVPPQPPQPTEEEIFQKELNVVLHRISQYDSSEDVNGFYIGEVPMWLDKVTRVGLMLRFQSEKAIGSNTTSLWYDDVKYELNLDDAMNMLTALEIYASACYDNTQYHIAEVKKITNLEDLKNYDYKVGYPEKLRF